MLSRMKAVFDAFYMDKQSTQAKEELVTLRRESSIPCVH